MGKDQIHSLIQKLLNGSISKEEFDTLNKWYNEKLDSNEINIILPYSRDEIHDRLKSNINKIVKPKKSIPLKIYFPVAASLLIISSILLYQYAYVAEDSTEFAISKYNYFTLSGEKKDILLPDGSEIKLNSQSSIRFYENDELRNISIEGEAFFDVKRNDKKPFLINTEFGEVKVLGTSFNVNLHDSLFSVFVKSGKVLVSLASNEIILIQNDLLRFNPKTNKSSITKGNTNSTSWVENKLIFDGVTLSNALRRFERWYGVEIEIQKKLDLDKKINASFNDVELSEAVRSLEFILDSKIIISNKKLILI